MVRAELRETRSLEETNWYFAIEVWACAWTIENMPKASAKLKFNKLVRNVGVVKKLRWKRFETEILSTVLFRNTIYQTRSSYQTSGLKLKKKRKIRKPKESPRRGIEQGLLRDRRG